jgi:hypothetical protein
MTVVQRPFVTPLRPRRHLEVWIHVECHSFPLPTQCVLLGCLRPSAVGNAFCSYAHYREACKLAAHGADGGRCGWTWSEP